jgi:hypothetical protein
VIAVASQDIPVPLHPLRPNLVSVPSLKEHDFKIGDDNCLTTHPTGQQTEGNEVTALAVGLPSDQPEARPGPGSRTAWPARLRPAAAPAPGSAAVDGGLGKLVAT